MSPLVIDEQTTHVINNYLDQETYTDYRFEVDGEKALVRAKDFERPEDAQTTPWRQPEEGRAATLSERYLRLTFPKHGVRFVDLETNTFASPKEHWIRSEFEAPSTLEGQLTLGLEIIAGSISHLIQITEDRKVTFSIEKDLGVQLAARSKDTFKRVISSDPKLGLRFSYFPTQMHLGASSINPTEPTVWGARLDVVRDFAVKLTMTTVDRDTEIKFEQERKVFKPQSLVQARHK